MSNAVAGEPRLSFHDDRYQFAWDSTSLGALKECPRKYQLSIQEGWRRKGESLHLRYGILYHRALEVYDHKTAQGMDHQTALRECLRDLALGCMDETEEVNAETGEIRTVRSWWAPDHASKTIPNLFRTVVWYLERFGRNDPAQTIILANGKPGVELSFRFEAGFEIAGVPILYSGHLDRVVEFNNLRWGMDRKTTAASLTDGSALRYFDQYTPDNQMSMYTLALDVAFHVPAQGIIIDAAQIAVGFSRFERGFATRTAGQLEDWHQSNKWWIEQAFRFADQDYWPMNDKSCDKYGGCPFRKVCAKDPAVQYVYLESDFHIQKWDPLRVRGDI